MPAALWLLVTIFIITVIYFLFFIQKLQNKNRNLSKEFNQINRAFSFLTSISGISSALNFIAEELIKVGFEKVLILTIDKKKAYLTGEVAMGFGEEFQPQKISLPLRNDGDVLSQAAFFNRFQVIENNDSSLNELGFPFHLTSFMVAPISKKGDTSCWKQKNCTKTNCPAFEKQDAPCWTIAKTRQTSPVWQNFPETYLVDPNEKIKACVYCDVFHPLGVILVAKDSKTKFSEEEKGIFRTFAYQAGAVLEKGYLLASLETRQQEISRRMYEISILKELGDRIGYSLNVQNIIDIITGSLEKLLEYSVVAYILLTGDRILFRCHLEQAVNRQFIDEVRKRMLDSLSALINRQINQSEVEEALSGTIVDDSVLDPVRSFFNIPLTINNRLVGLLMIASQKPGLYKEDEMTILYKIVAQASNAVSRLEAVLEVEKGKLNAMVSSMADGVLMIDNQNQIVVTNPATFSMLGINPKTNLTLFDIIDALSGKVDFRTKLEESIQTSKLVIMKEVLVRDKFLQILVSPVRDDKNKPLGVVVLFHDITEGKQLERVRQDFTAMMVHELRSPLTVVRGTTDTILRHGSSLDKKTSDDLLSSMKNSATSMLTLVNDLLDVAKIEAGKFSVSLQKVSILPVLKERVDYYKTLAEEKQIKLTTDFPEILPEVNIDSERIQQVLNNLLSNAIKYTNPEGTITIKAKQEQAEIIVCVQDTGLGIPQNKQDLIFSRFQQLVAPEYKGEKGTGLGLAIARGIVEAHGGKIWFESQEGKGSTFYFSLPLSNS